MKNTVVNCYVRRFFVIISITLLSLSLKSLLSQSKNSSNEKSRELRGATTFDEQRKIALIHIGKTGGTTVHRAIKNPTKGDEVSAHLKAYYHVKMPDLEKYDSFIVTIRNPVDRIISWFLYAHPLNALTPMTVDDKVDLYNCYPSINEFAVEGLDINAPSTHRSEISGLPCPELAQFFIRGNIRKKGVSYHPHYVHLSRNFEYHVKELLESEEKKDIFVVRTKSLYEDLDRIDKLLGGKGEVARVQTVTHHDNPAELKVTSKEIEPKGMENLCFFLCPEIQYYKKLINVALNLNDYERNISFEDLKSKCPIEASSNECHLPEL